MTNWVIIFNTQVIAVIEKDGNIDDTDLTASWDTVAQDDSKTFKVGDTFTAELQLQYNHDIWVANGWLKDPIPLTPEVESAKNLLVSALRKAGIKELIVRTDMPHSSISSEVV